MYNTLTLSDTIRAASTPQALWALRSAPKSQFPRMLSTIAAALLYGA